MASELYFNNQPYHYVSSKFSHELVESLIIFQSHTSTLSNGAAVDAPERLYSSWRRMVDNRYRHRVHYWNMAFCILQSIYYLRLVAAPGAQRQGKSDIVSINTLSEHEA